MFVEEYESHGCILNSCCYCYTAIETTPNKIQKSNKVCECI